MIKDWSLSGHFVKQKTVVENCKTAIKKRWVQIKQLGTVDKQSTHQFYLGVGRS